jgi:hypothetical protein
MSMRISRGNVVIGEWPVIQIKRRIEDGTLLLTDAYYEEDSSEWLPLADFSLKLAASKADKATRRLCYCASGLPFAVCHGDGSSY